jgi:glycosyltransferase involved in cell wall biosynthesis
VDSLVSVIIPNFNGALYLNEAVNSVLEQDYANKEVIVVDDGSTDDSVELLKAYGPKITLIESKNKGASTARNIGMSVAKGEYIAFLDSDDIWELNKLRLQIDYMRTHQLDLVYCHGQEFGNVEGLNVLHEAKFAGDCYQYFKKFPSKAIIDMGPSTAVIKSSRLLKTGVFDPSFTGPAEDWDFFRRYCRDAKVGFCDQILVHRRNHSSNVSNRSLMEYYLGNKRALLKMFAEDPDITFFQRQLIWAKFNFLSAKSFLKALI